MHTPETYKILMATMQMEIGGVETHLLELARALAARGHTVFVASRGGVFAEALEAAGVRHINVPLHKKTPLAVCKSYRMLYHLIKAEKFDIVHAHARIPAFICGLLRSRLPFCFFTTAHWVFKVMPLWRLLTNWGDHTLAVSQDIKQYLIDAYGLFPDNISVTVNGVNTDTFGAGIDYTDIAREFGLRENARSIVCISRMDKSRGAVPRMLAELAPALYARYPDIEIILVGGSVLPGEGGEFAAIGALAEKINRTAGRPVVILAGPRTDTERFIAAATVFVGVSRAALEAMSAEKPVILAGNEGCLGILDSQSLPMAYQTNFCCRGCPATDKSRLFGELCTLLDAPADDLKKLGRQNRTAVLSGYSLEKMTDDYEQAYRRHALCRSGAPGDIIISGYYGFDNLGDDSVLFSIINSLRAIDSTLNITVLCKNPKRLARAYGVTCIHRLRFFKIRRAMKKARLLISGGGSLLQNATSTKSLLYYAAVIKLAKRHGLPVMLYANGIGPVHGRREEAIVRHLVNISDIVTLREPASYHDLRRLGTRLDHVRVTADPALAIEAADDARVRFLMARAGFEAGRRYFAVSLRRLPGGKKKEARRAQREFEEKIAALVRDITERFDLCPVFIPLQPAEDRVVCLRVRRRTSEKGLLLEGLSAAEIVGLLGQMQFVIGMRLHILIYAYNAGVPMVGLSYDPKIGAFLDYAGLPGAFPCLSFDREKLFELVADFLKNQPAYKARTAKTRPALRKKAAENARIAAETAKGGFQPPLA